jgi:hypothetical protein
LFYLKDTKKEITAIEAIVSINGKKYKYATGESVAPAGWTNKKAKYNKLYPGGKTINANLQTIEKAITLATEFFILNKKQPQNSEFRSKVDQYLENNKQGNKMPFVAYMKLYLKQKQHKNRTEIKYTTAINKLEEYESKYRITLYFDSIDIDFYNHFKSWFYSLINEKTQRPYSVNYFGSTIKTIKRVMNYSLENELHNNRKFLHSEFIVTSEDVQTVYLTTAELMKIYELDITPAIVIEKLKVKPTRSQNAESKVNSLKRVRDRFLIGAFTALRVSDFNRLADIHFEGEYLKITTKKTAKPVVIPVHPIVRAIIDRGGLSYKISEQKINQHIKEVCRLAEITNPVTTTRTHAGKTIETTYEKCELIATHTARRSAATNMFKAGIPSINIMKITGHTTEKSFLKYIKITEEENAELLAGHAYFNG